MAAFPGTEVQVTGVRVIGVHATSTVPRSPVANPVVVSQPVASPLVVSRPAVVGAPIASDRLGTVIRRSA